MTNACINLPADSWFRYLYCALYCEGSKKALLQVLGTCEHILKVLWSQTAKFLMASSLGMITDSWPLCPSSNHHKFVFNHPLSNVPQTCLHSWDSSTLGSSVDRFELKIQLRVIFITVYRRQVVTDYRKKFTHGVNGDQKRGLNRSLETRHTWSIVSKAALRSRNTSKVTCCSFIFISISFHTCSRAVSVLWNVRHADWNSGYSWQEDMGWDNCWSTTFSVTLERNVRLLTAR